MSTSVDLKTQLGLIHESEVAAFRGLKIISLRNERARGKGPPYQRIGKKVFYPFDELKRFMAASTVKPTAKSTLIDGNRQRSPRTELAAP
jgi:hypothetical protein